ncbi:hypothetical protein SH611_03930 [Geminicoccaceae bacterium 1502E]|nr:hypothetical protein [Geminicoccaceae bacterium 1502E]
MAYQWLCGGIGGNHKSLADFRVGHRVVLERLLVDGSAALLETGVARRDRVAQDGVRVRVRVRAAAGAASFWRRSTLAAGLAAAAQEVGRLRAELEADPGCAGRREAADRRRAVLDRQHRVAQALEAAARQRGSSAARQRGWRRRGRPVPAGTGAGDVARARPCRAGRRRRGSPPPIPRPGA